jgi:hypothetical protein
MFVNIGNHNTNLCALSLETAVFVNELSLEFISFVDDRLLSGFRSVHKYFAKVFILSTAVALFFPVHTVHLNTEPIGQNHAPRVHIVFIVFNNQAVFISKSAHSFHHILLEDIAFSTIFIATSLCQLCNALDIIAISTQDSSHNQSVRYLNHIHNFLSASDNFVKSNHLNISAASYGVNHLARDCLIIDVAISSSLSEFFNCVGSAESAIYTSANVSADKLPASL